MAVPRIPANEANHNPFQAAALGAAFGVPVADDEAAPLCVSAATELPDAVVPAAAWVGAICTVVGTVVMGVFDLVAAMLEGWTVTTPVAVPRSPSMLSSSWIPATWRNELPLSLPSLYE